MSASTGNPTLDMFRKYTAKKREESKQAQEATTHAPETVSHPAGQGATEQSEQDKFSNPNYDAEQEDSDEEEPQSARATVGSNSFGSYIRKFLGGSSNSSDSSSLRSDNSSDDARRLRKGKGKAPLTNDPEEGDGKDADGLSPLTIGVEFEFNLGELKKDYPGDPHPHLPQPGRDLVPEVETEPEPEPEVTDNWNYNYNWYQPGERLRDSIAAVLSDQGHPCVTDDQEGWQWYLKTDPTIKPSQFDPEEYGGWEEDPYHWEGLELVTPAYIYNDAAVKDVMDVLGLVTSNYRTLTNSTCGLHVHVGLGPNPLELHTLRRMIAFLWSFEPVLEKVIHEKQRIRLDTHSSFYCKGLRTGSRFAVHLNDSDSEFHDPGTGPDHKKRVRPTLARIMKTKSHQALYELVSHYSRYRAYNLEAARFSGPFSEGRHTVEFRQHAGTLDQDRAEAWILTVTGIVRFCRTADPETFSEALLAQARFEERGCAIGKKGRWGLRKLFEWVGIEPRVADLYLNNRNEWRYGNGLYEDDIGRTRPLSVSSFEGSEDSLDSDEFESAPTSRHGQDSVRFNDSDVVEFEPAMRSYVDHSWTPTPVGTPFGRPRVPQRPRFSLDEEEESPWTAPPAGSEPSPYGPFELPAELPGSFPEPTVPSVSSEATTGLALKENEPNLSDVDLK